MPLIDVQLLNDVLNAEQKKLVIQKLTDAIASIAGENLRGATWVKIYEVNSGEWGIGGKPLTTEAVKKIAAGGKTAGSAPAGWATCAAMVCPPAPGSWSASSITRST